MFLPSMIHPSRAATVRRDEKDTSKTMLWWALLSTLALFNILLWAWTWSTVEAINPYQRAHLVLSGVYVMVCAYRSVLPRIDLERYCLIDTQLSSVFLGRLAATIAEVSFATQLALLLYELGETSHLYTPQTLCWIVVPALSLAQCFCWYGLLTLNHLGHAIEESLWAGTLVVVGMGLLPVALYSHDSYARLLASIGMLFSAGYVYFMVTVDVPMYLSRWREGRKAGRQLFTLQKGRVDAWHRRVVTQEWKVWKHEVAWLTGYFSLAVWTSVAFVHFPR